MRSQEPFIASDIFLIKKVRIEAFVITVGIRTIIREQDGILLCIRVMENENPVIRKLGVRLVGDLITKNSESADNGSIIHTTPLIFSGECCCDSKPRSVENPCRAVKRH